MDQSLIDTFVKLILGEEALQAQLRDVTDKQEFLSRVMELGVQNGYDFSADDLENVMRSNRQLWQKT